MPGPPTRTIPTDNRLDGHPRRSRVGLIRVALVLAASCIAAASRAPGVDRQEETGSIQTANLATLGKVWGFAKYHHPRIAAGDVDWDARLLQVLPAVMAAPDREAGLDTIRGWIDALGPIAPCDPCAEAPRGVELEPPIDWIRDTETLGRELSGRLEHIYDNRPAGASQHYIRHRPGVGNPELVNEKEYTDEPAPGGELRLLALYRFWNVIAYWFPYRDLIDDDLDALLAEFIPELLADSGGERYRLTLHRLVARAKDTHANLWSDIEVRPPGGALRAPVAIRFIEDRPVVTAHLHEAYGPEPGLEVGDVVVAVDGVPIEALIRDWEPYYAASNQPTRLRDIGRNLLRGSTATVEVAVDRDGRRLDVTASRLPGGELDLAAGGLHDLPGPAFRMLEPDVAYLKLSSVVADSAARYVEQAAGTRVFVIDIRNYPSEFVVFALGGHLVAEPTPFARFTRANASNPGAFRMGPAIELRPLAPRYEGRVVILVDETTQSQAEYTAMAFRTAPGAMVVGSTTAGADGNVSPIPLPGGVRSLISGIGVFYPDGTPTQRVGIVPDLVVAPTIRGIREGRDEVLEAGVSAALGRPFRLER